MHLCRSQAVFHCDMILLLSLCLIGSGATASQQHPPAGGTWPRQRHRRGGRLALWVVVGECHQAQLVLGVESVVDHDSAMCFGLSGPHPAQNEGMVFVGAGLGNVEGG